jgi:hypothetical protein
VVYLLRRPAVALAASYCMMAIVDRDDKLRLRRMIEQSIEAYQYCHMLVWRRFAHN